MTIHKKYPKKQLEKYSNIFGQIGLILILWTIYILIEYNVPVEKLSIHFDKNETNVASVISYPDFFEKEKPKVEKKEKIKKTLVILDEIDKRKKQSLETLLPDANIEEVFDIDKVKEVDQDEYIDSKDDPNQIYDARTYTPVFRGCEGLEGDENRMCFESKLKKFVQKKFDTNLGLQEGTYRIFSEFVINKEGNVVGVRIKAPSKGLEKEMRRVIKKLPKFLPGKQGDKPVNVKYILPLAFKVD